MTVILSRPTNLRTERALVSNPIKRLTTMISAYLAPKVKTASAIAAPVAKEATLPAPTTSSAPTDEKPVLRCTAPILPPAVFADDFPGKQDKDDDVPMFDHQDDLTEAEGHMLETMREWTKAQTDPYLRSRLAAWYNLRYNVDWFQKGTFTLKDAVDGWGEEDAPAMYAAIEAVATVFPLFSPHYYSSYEERKTLPHAAITIPTTGEAAVRSPDVDADDVSEVDLVARTENERSILDLFRHLSETEQNMLLSAAFDAEDRTHALAAGDDITTRHHRTIVDFAAWLHKIHDDKLRIPEMRGNNLTANQNKRLDCAWEIIAGVFAEAETESEEASSVNGSAADNR